LATHGRPSTVEDLAAHACIRFGREGRIAAWRLTAPDGSTRTLTPTGRLIMGHGEAVLDAALAGQGLAYLPTWLMGAALARGELEMVLSDSAVDDLPVHALWPKTRDLAPKIRVVVDDLLRHFSPVPPWTSRVAPAMSRRRLPTPDLASSSPLRAQILERIDGIGPFADLEMELGRGDVAGAADLRDGLAAFHLLAALDQQFFVVA